MSSFRAGVNIKALVDDEAFMKSYRAWLASDMTQRMLLHARRLALPEMVPLNESEFMQKSSAALYLSAGANGILDFIGSLDDLKAAGAGLDIEASYQMAQFLDAWNHRPTQVPDEAPSGSPPRTGKPSKKAIRVSGGT